MKKGDKNNRGQGMKSKISPASLYSSKKAQMQLSFGMIFSIILIIFFVAFAFFGIKKFLGIQEYAQIEKFKSDLQGDIDDMWRSTQSEGQEVKYDLPRKVEKVCFINDEYENLFFVPDDFKGGKIKNINFDKTLGGKDELCISTSDRKIRMTLKKDYRELIGVTITE